MTFDREELKRRMVASVASSLAVREPPTPPPTPVKHTRRPRRPRVLTPPTGDLQEYVLGQRASITLTQREWKHTYRISRPRDYNPENPINFIGAEHRGIYQYIGLIRPPGPFMWGRKSKLSASDPRVILFDQFYSGLMVGAVDPEIIVERGT
jgi:hypothetical protein